MDPDAYKPPSAQLVDPEPVGQRLYSPGQVVGATFMGTPIAGFWLIAQNYGALGEYARRMPSLVVGCLVTVPLLAIALTLPRGFLSTMFLVVQLLLVDRIARHLQGAQIDAHIAAGGKIHSSWRVVGIGLATGVLVIVVGALGIVLFAPTEFYAE